MYYSTSQREKGLLFTISSRICRFYLFESRWPPSPPQASATSCGEQKFAPRGALDVEMGWWTSMFYPSDLFMLFFSLFSNWNVKTIGRALIHSPTRCGAPNSSTRWSDDPFFQVGKSWVNQGQPGTPTAERRSTTGWGRRWWTWKSRRQTQPGRGGESAIECWRVMYITELIEQDSWGFLSGYT